ncbi:MAG: beta-propeller fold lactonase family protein, partial [Gammaproteobacteria bacterium]|nr:beta-propeller fold lactonase family protein [Gammaproteobacteria bacterium]
EIEVGEEPEGVMADPNGKRVYVTSEVANMVHVVDVTSNELVANIVVGNRPRRFALTPDGSRLWVTNEIGGSVSIIDTAGNQVVGEIRFAPKGFRAEDVTPVGLVMDKAGKTAYVTLGGANHVAVVDVASAAVEDYILVGRRPWGLALNRAESLLYVTNGKSDDLSVIDVAKRRVQRSAPVGRVPHSVVVYE